MSARMPVRKPGYGLSQDSRGRWIATVRVSGKRHYRVLGGGSRRVAERLAGEWAAEIRQTQAKPDAGTIAELCEQWIRNGPDVDRTPSYTRSSRQVIDSYIIPGLGDVPAAQLTVADVDKMLQALTARGLKPATVRQARAVLRSVLTHAERAELLDRNVARLSRPPRQDQAPHRIPTAGQVAAAIDTAWRLGPMPGALIHLAAVTGGRRGELVAIRWEDIDLADGLVTITASLTGLKGGDITRGPTKTRQTRTLALPDDLAARLRAEHDRQTRALGHPPTWLAWSDPAGSIPWRPDRLTKTWERIRAGIPGLGDIRLHDIRHWVGSELIDSGESLVSAAAHLGHSSTAMLAARYGHPTQDAAKRRADLLGAKLDTNGKGDPSQGPPPG